MIRHQFFAKTEGCGGQHAHNNLVRTYSEQSRCFRVICFLHCVIKKIENEEDGKRKRGMRRGAEKVEMGKRRAYSEQSCCFHIIYLFFLQCIIKKIENGKRDGGERKDRMMTKEKRRWESGDEEEREN
jgi:hypothetical protein